ncbi:MAG: hypothetical protein JEY99_11485 [Spirochaetales bacterium]|nr:hypothetical protein [Spirochaetales bacterium]
MRKQLPAVLLVLILLITPGLLGSCVMNKLSEEPETISLNQNMGGSDIGFEIVKGESWSRRMKAGPLVFNILPQVVIWVTDENDNFLKTLYVTGADGKGFRHAGRKELGRDFYRESFPLWSSLMENAGELLPDEDTPYPDSITSATPSAGFTLNTKINIHPGTYQVFMEINQSSDYNDTYTEENSDWAGQPSVIYHAEIPGKPEGKRVAMEVWGRGTNIGESGASSFDMSGMDSALTQILKAGITF